VVESSGRPLIGRSSVDPGTRRRSPRVDEYVPARDDEPELAELLSVEAVELDA
jgi:hypothetical protein